MYNENNGVKMEPVATECCGEPNRGSITNNAVAIGKMLEEAKCLVSDMGTHLFGDEEIKGERPAAKCLAHEMELNVAGMESLLSEIKFMYDRLK